MHTVRQEKEIKDIHIGKKEIQLPLYTDNTTASTENLKESAFKKFVEISDYRKVVEYNVNI